MSGLWTLIFQDGRSVLVESGFGVRQLAACFGATEGSGDLLEKVVGQEIVFSTDDFGMLGGIDRAILAGFTPIEEWTGPDLEIGVDYDDDEIKEAIENAPSR
jgi:hypothetical protein